MEIKNKLIVTKGEGVGENRGNKRRGQTKEHSCERTHGHGLMGSGRLSVGVETMGQKRVMEKKGGATVTEQ